MIMIILYFFMEEKNHSFYLDQALLIINIVKNTKLSFEERIQKSIELSELLILHAKQTQTASEKLRLENLTRVLSTAKGKSFLINLLDQILRLKSKEKIIDVFSYLINSFGSIKPLPLKMKIGVFFSKIFGSIFPTIFANHIRKEILKEALNTFTYADETYLNKYIQKNKNNDVIFWLLEHKPFEKKDVDRYLSNIFSLITREDISSVCINLTSLSSHLNAPFNNLMKNEIEENFINILKFALNASNKNKTKKEKIIILDFEEHAYLESALEIFEKIILMKEFLNLKIGFTLKSYFPESFEIQKKLHTIAKKRLEINGNSIIIRITKGIHLNSELITASLNNWPSPTFTSKIQTDANFKKMIAFASNIENTNATDIIISTSNIFDIAYSLLLIEEKKLDQMISFEIIDSKTTTPIILTLQKIIGKNLKLLSPIIFKNDFEVISIFSMQKIYDYSNLENFISQLEILFPGTKNWDEQVENFKNSFNEIQNLSSEKKLKQNRNKVLDTPKSKIFENDPITDFSIQENILWGEKIIDDAKKNIFYDIPIVIDGKEIISHKAIKNNFLNKPLYNYSQASDDEIILAITTAKINEKNWQELPIEKKIEIFSLAVSKFKEKRSFFIKNLIIDINKSLVQADLEVSEAIDAIEYQIKNFVSICSYKDIDFQAKGTILIIPAWGFPLVVSATALTSALLGGNTVILKPLEESILVCFEFIKILWDAGVPKEVLQFVNCSNELFEKKLISDSRINSVIISTAAENAKKFIKLRDGLEVNATTGGINTIIVTALSDKHLAIENIIESAFSFSGQKFSSCAVLILEKEVYDDINFQNQLKEATENLIVDSATNPNSFVTPLTTEPTIDLKKALTMLDPNEWWLVKPKQSPNNPRLFSPGVKYGVTQESFTKNHELYCPVLSVMKADSIDHAIELANKSKFGLSAGLQSLDAREHLRWINNIQVGNYYINTPLTETRIKRQPFGGYKESSFGSGYKFAGPNYNLNFLKLNQATLPKEKQPVNDWVNSLTIFLEKIDLSPEELGLWYASVSNYAYSWKKFKQDIDSSKILGQDNFLRYVPRKNITFRITNNYLALDALRVCAAALTCSTPLEISWDPQEIEEFDWIDLLPVLTNIEETEEEFLNRIRQGKIKRIRLINKASEKLKKAAAIAPCHIIDDPVLANGRFELLHYIKEINITCNYHRYGNLGSRESELRKPIQ